MIRTASILVALLIALCGLAACERAATPSGAVKSAVPDATPRVTEGVWKDFPVAVRDALARGVNAANWFNHRSDTSVVPGWPDAADFAQMRQLGLGHVRVLLDPHWLELNAAHPRFLRTGLEQAMNAGLMVVLAMQPEPEQKLAMARDDAGLERLVTQWSAIAREYATVPDDRLVFEVLNEPEIEDVARAVQIQSRLIDAVRSVSPTRVVAVGGAHFSDVEDLERLQPFPQARVIYSFHFYEPHNFTHQGASWGWPMWMVLRGLPYPSSPSALEPVLPQLTPMAREHAAWYGQQQWNRAKLAEFVDRAGAWSSRHQLPVWCSEFGVLREAAPPASRRNWLTDARSLFEERGIAWSYFDWWGHFGLVTGAPGARVLDEDAAAGLGLAAK